jgi:hypothetical protein
MHPQHDALMENDPWLFLEGVFRDAEMPHATAKALTSSHTVEVVGLAVHEEVSRLAGERRFLDNGRAVDAARTPRPVVPDDARASGCWAAVRRSGASPSPTGPGTTYTS